MTRGEARSLLHARASRSAAAPGNGFRREGTLVWRARVTGGMAGNLLLRSLERADRVYAAMLSRGYDGELPDTDPRALTRGEWVFLFAVLMVLVSFFLFSLIAGAPA